MPFPGKISASKTDVLLVNGKQENGFGVGAITYARLLARQIVGIEDEPDYKGWDIERGLELEWEACETYGERTLSELTVGKWTTHPKFDFFGGTPDRLVGMNGGVDAKCPNNDNHHKNIMTGAQLDDYRHQFQSYMAIFGRDWWDLASYNPNYPEPLDLATFRMERDEVYINRLLERVEAFYPIVLKFADELKMMIPK